MTLDLTAAFRGREVLITGVTGFLGKVALTMLLDRYPEVGKVYVLVRPRAGGTAEDRFFHKVATSPPFRPLVEKHGDRLEAFLREKCVPLAGDVTDPLFGLSNAQVEQLKGRLACVINSAGLVTFNPSLETAISVNTEGALHAAELCRHTSATLIHISTCFVAGARRGPVFEDEPLIGSFPRQHDDDFKGVQFSVDTELKDVDALVARLRAQADDHALGAQFRAAAVKRLEEEGRDPRDEKALRLATGRERKLWLGQQLVQAGMDRARAWGWPNTYTYTKAMGEQAIAASGCKYALVRPAIVESAMRFPFPGWNEGFTTSAPLAFMALKGHRAFPAGHKLVLDLIPVDLVAAGILGVAGAACAEALDERVFQLASGDVNPFYVRRAVELNALYKRKYFRDRPNDRKSMFQRWLDEWLEPYPVPGAVYERTSTPLFRQLAKAGRKLIEERGASWGMPVVSAMLARADQTLETVDRQLAQIDLTWELFLPFVAGERFVFQCTHTRALWARLTEADREKLPWDPERIDWRGYWMDTHMRGLEEWVFPGLEEESKALRRELAQPKDMLALLAAAVHAYGPRVALRFYAGEENAAELARTRDDRVTYDELARFSDRAAQSLMHAGVAPGERVLLMSENRPEWAMAYFGILKAGATAAPLDHGMSAEEVRNCAIAARARILVASPRVIDRLGKLDALRVLPLQDVLRELPEGVAHEPVRTSAAADEVASILFTSGTTGTPKGVQLTHRNFTSLATKLAGLFDLRVGEGVLSVLPLHHTFEFSCGLLTPLMLGAEITYLDELTAERLSDALDSGRIHAMIGVPALWQLLHRRLTQELASRPRAVQAAIEAAMALHGELRNRTPFNVGKLLFWPIHSRFGGRLRLLVSGGSALPADVQEAFHQLGFSLTEGYGLTEAAPVLAVTVPENRLQTGTVGPPIPGVEIRIENPNDEGVGEVLAKGPNVMAGYLDDPDATAEVLSDGWLRTGDLGRLTPEGHLQLVGRKKDVILDASGKNVYPDELEELYGATDLIKELSVVGLPDPKGHESVACMAVVRTPKDDETREELRREALEHFAKISSRLPFWKRVKVLHFQDVDLPKTATRKVKRPLVVRELQRMEAAAAKGETLQQAARASGDEWLYHLVADLAQRPRASVGPHTRFVADLGFDSLLVAELVVALEKAGVKPPDETRLASLHTVADLAAAIERPGSAQLRETSEAALQNGKREEEIAVPDSVAAAGRAAIAFFQRALYGNVFEVDVEGRANVPHDGAFLVAANHASHLDVGLVNYALGEEGRKLASLAARDYFFDNPWKRAWFGSFTNLVPIERRGSLKESLQTAVRTLEYGYHLLIFPEGTRSPDGNLQEFKPAIAYLSFAACADILPVWLDGTYEAMPKGAFAPDPRKRRKLRVRIGPPLRYAALKAVTAGMPRSAAHKEVTRLVREAIEALRDGTPPPRVEARARSRLVEGEGDTQGASK